ncbi:MAG: hypothetical protein JO011_05185 [Ktedonobacteraceae bacterium]|nr:hypothetical protein [Ktedonobacteraceae bacterium]
MLTERDLKRKFVKYREVLLRLIESCASGHADGDLSWLDVLNVLYEQDKCIPN